MSDDDKADTPKQADGHADCSEPYVMPPEVPERLEQKKKTFGEKLKTVNPIAWAEWKFKEPKLVFDPHSLKKNADPDQANGTLEHPSTYGLKGFDDFELRLPTGEHVTAWYKPAKPGFPTIVFCHGNAGSLAARADFLKEFTVNPEHPERPERGFGVIIAAYPGFPGNKDRAAVEPSEQGCNATGYAMVQNLLNDKKIPMENIALFGHSLGGSSGAANRTQYSKRCTA